MLYALPSQVRDFEFRPEDGYIKRIVLDKFGLSFLPLAFFECKSLPAPYIINIHWRDGVRCDTPGRLRPLVYHRL